MTTNANTISRTNYLKSVCSTTDQDGYVRLTFGNTEYRLTAHAAEMLADEITSAARMAKTRPQRLKVALSTRHQMERSDGEAEAVRYWKSEGATFSGWIVRSTHNSYSYSDPIPTQAEARRTLLTWDIEPS